ncbi:MAG: hypothetical protein ACTTKP_09050 [Catonella sp.]|uniref:hypothetical protein n=1 Tax=Catonella sp. TaxID=2382125 RepID=UPI003F9F046B
MKNSEPLVLKVVDKCVQPFLSKDLNYNHIREMLKLKLIMDSRRIPIGTQKKSEKLKKEPKRSMLLTCLVYLFIGLFIAAMQSMPNIFGGNMLGFSMLIFILFSAYISEYSAVLLDTTEKSFYGALPIGHNEINTAKNIHIAYYIGTIAFSMMLPSMITAFIFHGALYGLLFVVMSVVITVFCLHLAGTIYYLLLKVFSGEKLKDILSGFQVFMTIAMVLAYQIVPRVINFAEFAKAELTFSPFFIILPPAWFAGILAVFFAATSAGYYYILAGMAVAALVLLEIVYKRKVMPEFEGELDKLTETAKENKSLSTFSMFLCKMLSKDEQENAFMKLVLIQISRNRDIKLKLYPQLANALILPFIILLSQLSRSGGFTGLMTTVRESRWTLALLYSVGLTSSVLYTIISQSGNKESLLFYQVLPIENLSKCIRAGVKIVLFRYITPVFIILSAIFFVVCGIKVLPDIVLAYIAFIFITSFEIRISSWVLPFSTETATNNAGYNMMMFLINMIVLGGAGFLHIFFLNTILLQVLGIVVMMAANLVLWKLFMNKKYVIARE